jgi:hypothetical protein
VSCLSLNHTFQKDQVKMDSSFREIANLMDPVKPARDIRALAAMHRWPSGSLPNPLTARSILDRHYHPRKVTQRFLFYNTYLLPGFELNVKDFVADVICPDIPVIGGLVDWICEKPIKAILSVIPDGYVRCGSKPAMIPRAREIGRAIAHEYDIVALCELFSNAERHLVLDGFKIIPHTAEGPDDSGDYVVLSSGLFTISSRRLITRRKAHTFEERGNRYRDTDAWANKGVLLSEIDLGLERGNLEVYSTHLFSGNDMPVHLPDIDQLGLDSELSVEERLRVQFKQVNELANFVKENHQRRNVALVVGDFNIDAYDRTRIKIDGLSGTPVTHLSRKMRAIGMGDLWDARNGTLMYTSRLDVEGAKICDDQNGGRYCDDLREPRAKTTRIDYIFAERQMPEHGFILDFTRPRRVPFRRALNTEDRNKIAFLSDHVGLEVTLIATPI